MKSLIQLQKDEINSSLLYEILAHRSKDEHNKQIFTRLSLQERHHYEFLKKHTGKEVKPSRFLISLFRMLATILGNTFVLKLMEISEGDAQQNYVPYEHLEGITSIIKEEDAHETQLFDMLNDKRLNYMGSVVLGLNDALVELTGALAGFTLALQNPQLISLTGSITGVAAALSMASSEYLSRKSDGETTGEALQASLYTGGAYLITVVILILPFLLISNVLWALVFTIVLAMAIIAVFNFYYSVVKDESFKKRFWEMALISFGVAIVSFAIGYVLNKFIGA
ncbi:MAG: VIT1/CCC1 transporter family protein [Dysgonamonadaceae bacterium]